MSPSSLKLLKKQKRNLEYINHSKIFFKNFVLFEENYLKNTFLHNRLFKCNVF